MRSTYLVLRSDEDAARGAITDIAAFRCGCSDLAVGVDVGERHGGGDRMGLLDES